jgi:hypothetical protein
VLLLFGLLPGLLESLLNPLIGFEALLYVSIFLIFFLCVFLLILAAYEIIQILSSKQEKLQISGILSLLIIITTGFLLFFKIPARLFFHTTFLGFEKSLAQDLAKNPSGNQPLYYQSMSFIRIESPNECNEQYGFAYLPDQSKARYEITHLHDKWYIYGGCASPMDVQ